VFSSHVHGLDGQALAHAIGYRPADDHARAQVEDRGQVQRPSPVRRYVISPHNLVPVTGEAKLHRLRRDPTNWRVGFDFQACRLRLSFGFGNTALLNTGDFETSSASARKLANRPDWPETI
jgi:hypothetical protein